MGNGESRRDAAGPYALGIRVVANAYSAQRAARDRAFGHSCHAPTDEEVAELRHRSVVLAAQMELMAGAFGMDEERVIEDVRAHIDRSAARVNGAVSGPGRR